ncbi:guanylate kinase [Strigomonas culicis]|uniref:Guanylate kinase n=1 Tax=Strigomonas culicis TaxID=28005 RepID=S9VKP6_9TRYP|nr:guanylate kinase [Strigomonas culicis]|eukprot:EPY27641.1 guanylate kinase [Strigomonas culicis]
MPRDGEQHGRDYWFVEKRQFKKMVELGEMVEYTVMRAHPEKVDLTPPEEAPSSAAHTSQEDPEMDEEERKEKRALERAVEALIPLTNTGALNRSQSFVIDPSVHTNYYGTSKKAIFQMLRLNKCVLMDTDLRGALTLRYTCHRVGQATDHHPNPNRWPYTCCIVLVLPPNMEVVQQRLLNRHSETPSSLKMRMELNRQWMQFYERHGSLFDCKVVTHELDSCVRELEQRLNLVPAVAPKVEEAGGEKNVIQSSL